MCSGCTQLGITDAVHSQSRAARQAPARAHTHPRQARRCRCTSMLHTCFTLRQATPLTRACAVALVRTCHQDTDVFSPDEKQQLCEMLALASLNDVDAIVALVTHVFVDAAHFGKVNRDHALLRHSSVSPDVLALVEKAWRKKSKAVAPQIAAKHALDASSAPVLIESNWRLHVEMAQSKLRGLSEPSAIFQLALQDPSAAQRVRACVVNKLKSAAARLCSTHTGLALAHRTRSSTLSCRTTTSARSFSSSMRSKLRSMCAAPQRHKQTLRSVSSAPRRVAIELSRAGLGISIERLAAHHVHSHCVEGQQRPPVVYCKASKSLLPMQVSRHSFTYVRSCYRQTSSKFHDSGTPALR